MTTAVIIVSGQSLAGDLFQSSDALQDGVVTTLSNPSAVTGYRLAQNFGDSDGAQIASVNAATGETTLNNVLAAEVIGIRFLEQNLDRYDDVIVVRAASGGKPILDQSSSSQPSFFDENGGASGNDDPFNAVGDGSGAFDGALMTSFVKPAIEDALDGLTDLELVGVVWAQGEADTSTLGSRDDNANGDNPTEEALYAAGLEYVFDEIVNFTLNHSGGDFDQGDDVDPTLFIQHIGRRTSYGSTGGDGLDDVKTIQQNLAEARSDVVIASESYDLALRDGVHPTAENYHIAAERMGAFIGGGESGPRVTDVALSNQGGKGVVTLTVALPDGFTAADLRAGADAADLLFVRDEGPLSNIDDLPGEAYIPVESLQISGTTLIFTLSRELQGDGVVTYGYGGAISEDALSVLGDRDLDIEPVFLENGDLDQPLYAFIETFTASDYGAPDATAPTLIGSTPSDDAADVAAGDAIVLTFSEVVVRGAGAIELIGPGGAVPASVTINGNQVTIAPNAALSAGESYEVRVDAGALEDAAGNDFAGLSGGALDFTVAGGAPGDTQAPQVISTGPATGADDVAVSADFTITYDEAIFAGAGYANVILVSGGARTLVERIQIDGANARIDGATLTLDPIADLRPGADYYIQLSSDAVRDAAGNGSATQASQNFLAFETATGSGDAQPPRLISTTPSDDATRVAPDATITLTYDETVVAGSGYANLVQSTAGGNVLIERFFADDPEVTIAGGVVTLDPTADLAEGATFFLQFSADFVRDAAGNGSDLMASQTALDFTTGAAEAPGAASTARAAGHTGTADDDLIIGTALGEKLDGKGGNDELRGLDGDDILRGRDGNDTLLGGDGDDELVGDGGDDILDGGVGDDDLDGRAGNDTLRFGPGVDEVEGGLGADRFEFLGGGVGSEIRDFNVSEGDVLDLSAVTGGAASAAGVVELTQSGGETIVRIDADGGGDGFVDAFSFRGDAAGVDLATLIADGDILL